ncbi:hypothetical protein RhiirA4_550878 [Rhizophagus irregularis]|uniref:Uncharacterized protein n=1 Tax=Rhizophagus irregularis TaxID=588596 RepID=A0A2I1HQL3_9GLOM|nr:hypothetical protein RhiirA4_550878 [Rhizophagus irregularis]
MGMWQVEALKLYNRSLRQESKYYVFIHLYIDAIKKEKEGDIGIKNRLDIYMVIKRIGNLTIEEVGVMMAYSYMRNSISHKKKWDIEKDKNGKKDGVKNKKTYDDVLKCFRELEYIENLVYFFCDNCCKLSSGPRSYSSRSSSFSSACFNKEKKIFKDETRNV